MKKIAAILFCLLLMLEQSVPAAPAAMGCHSVASAPCHMACCAAKPAPGPQSVPAPSPAQNQILPPATAGVLWTLPGTEAGRSSSASTLSLPVMSAPLYARNCSRLL